MSVFFCHLSSGHGQETDVPVEVPAGELTQLQLQVLQPTVTEAEAQELKQVNCKLHFLKIMLSGQIHLFYIDGTAHTTLSTSKYHKQLC